MRWQSLVYACVCVLSVASFAQAQRYGSPGETVREAQTVLTEALTTPGAEIPAKLLSEAHGVAIIPRVLKIGFIGAVRRGHGVVIVRDKDGNWGAPQFITLTGGSIGWQIGAQSTDVILVFNSERSVQGLLSGKFTIGADAAAAAGPVGRNLAAATDAQLRAEILSYSRSRGLFAGVSIDGSVIDIDPTSSAIYYAARPGEQPRVPEEAARLVASIAELSGGGTNLQLAPAHEERALRVDDAEAIRRQLAQSAIEMNALLKEEWQRYLALPRGVYDPKDATSAAQIAAVLRNFETVAASPQYASLTGRPEFQRTLELLRAYQNTLSAPAPSNTLNLPPPPGK
jgi:lipid-binding SYLF domain-containing protein